MSLGGWVGGDSKVSLSSTGTEKQPTEAKEQTCKLFYTPCSIARIYKKTSIYHIKESDSDF